MTKEKGYKWSGLFVALVLPLVVSIIFKRLGVNSGSIPKEATMWCLLILLFLIVKYGEKESFVVLGFSQRPAKSLGYGLLILLSICLALAIYMGFYFLIFKTRPPQEKWVNELAATSIWMKLLIAIRAGVTEETFFRAYGISRLKQLTGNKYVAVLAPLVIFAGGHYSYGTFNHVAAAFVTGGVMTYYYLKRKNLVANIIAHTLLDATLLLIH